MPGFTPTQQRILNVLSDGMPHTKEEMRDCLNDELSGGNNLRVHLTYLRKKLRTVGQTIVYEFQWPNKMLYRHVRLLASANDGKS